MSEIKQTRKRNQNKSYENNKSKEKTTKKKNPKKIAYRSSKER